MRRSLREIYLYNLRNDFSGLLNNDGITDTNIFAVNLINIMKRRMLHLASSNHHRLHGCARRECSTLAHLPVDASENGGLLLSGIFECNSPTWRFGGDAQLPLIRERVNLDHHSVDGIWEFGARVCKSFDLCDALVC